MTVSCNHDMAFLEFNPLSTNFTKRVKYTHRYLEIAEGNKGLPRWYLEKGLIVYSFQVFIHFNVFQPNLTFFTPEKNVTRGYFSMTPDVFLSSRKGISLIVSFAIQLILIKLKCMFLPHLLTF